MSDTHHHDPNHDTHVEDHSHDWFRHATGEFAQEDHGSFNSTMVVATILVTMAVVAAVILILYPITKRSLENLSVVRQEQNEAAFTEFRNAQNAWDAALHSEPTWINRAEGTLQIPFEIAAQRVVQQYAQP
ncbi:MAG: hypothetical protein ACTS3F_12040 [Phycisphaerales bacterium]